MAEQAPFSSTDSTAVGKTLQLAEACHTSSGRKQVTDHSRDGAHKLTATLITQRPGHPQADCNPTFPPFPHRPQGPSGL